jgi:hypothetical protein
MEVKTWSINLVVYELSSARPDFDVLSASVENKIGAHFPIESMINPGSQHLHTQPISSYFVFSIFVITGFCEYRLNCGLFCFFKKYFDQLKTKYLHSNTRYCKFTIWYEQMQKCDKGLA